jgi:flagellar biosynthetic protein FliS
MYGQMELAYRRSAAAGASPIGLMIAMYDTLSGNLRRAATAVRNNNIEQRCHEVNHGMLVLGQLESMIDPRSGDEMANSLTVFYSYIRSQMMTASFQQSAEIFEAQIELVLQVRSAWQQRDMAVSRSVPAELLAGDAGPFREHRSLSVSM